MLRREFIELNQSDKWWQKGQKVLLAISGGVDSMVLLELFNGLPVNERPEFGVAHVNHQLRAESEEEATFLRNYCLERGIPYYEHVWRDVDQLAGNLEAEARSMRYAFFAKVCQEAQFSCLVTAHHSDDQAETVLMKLTTGSQLQNLVGIRAENRWSDLVIYRPLLAYSKATLEAFALAHELTYFEDQTNNMPLYFRNRIRNQVIPKLKAENANFLKHIHSFVKQIAYASDIIEDNVKELYPQFVTQRISDGWQLDLNVLMAQKESMQYFLLVAFLQKTLVEQQVEVNDSQLVSILTLLTGAKAQGEYHLAGGWLIQKRYKEGFLIKPSEQREGQQIEQSHQLSQGDSIRLNKDEWLALESVAHPLEIPKEMRSWRRYQLELTENAACFPLTIRHAQTGDRFRFNQQGNKKGVNRLFIDRKLSLEKREKTWIVCDSEQEILWIVPIRKSYLSIRKETDKIHYRLIYLKNEQDLEGDSYVGERH